mgnify:CR=1 FL=1
MNKKVRNKRKLNTKKIALLLIMIAIIVGSIILAIRKSKTLDRAEALESVQFRLF